MNLLLEKKLIEACDRDAGFCPLQRKRSLKTRTLIAGSRASCGEAWFDARRISGRTEALEEKPCDVWTGPRLPLAMQRLSSVKRRKGRPVLAACSPSFSASLIVGVGLSSVFCFRAPGPPSV